MSIERIVGIDPGASGGIATLVLGTSVMDVQPMPWITNLGINAEAIRTFVLTASHVVIEDFQLRPGEGIKATRTTCVNWGRIVGIVEGLGRPLTVVHPRRWQSAMLPGLGKRDKAARKAFAVQTAQHLWPQVSFMPTARCRVASDGMAEAALIAEYGRRLLAGHFAGVGK